MNGAGIFETERAFQAVVGGVVLFVVVATLFGAGVASADDGTVERTTTAVQEEEPWIHVNASDAQGQAGDIVAVDITVEELKDDREEEAALGYNILLNYDQDVIKFVEAESVAFDNVTVYQDPPVGTEYETEPENSGEYGVLRLADMETDTEATPTFTAVRVRFELVGDPGDQTTIEIPGKTEDGEELSGVSRNPLQGWPATFGSGTVTILEAQAETGTVSGTVTDDSGSPISGASVRVGGSEVTTGSDGTYELEVQSGSYELQVSADGYDGTSTQVEVSDGQNVTADATLVAQETPAESDDDESGNSQLTTIGQAVGFGTIVAGLLALAVAVVARFTSVLPTD